MTSSVRVDAIGPAVLQLSFHHPVETWAERTPGAIAIAAPGRAPLTYGRLHAHIDDVVQKLKAMGVRRNDRIAIVLPNGPEIAVAFLSVAAYATAAPLNPALKEKEFDFYLSDLGAKALIVHSEIDTSARSAAKARGIAIIELSPAPTAEAGIFTLGGRESAAPAEADESGSEHVALVLHTSGTTSRPKMVPLTQKNLCASAYHIASTLDLSAEDRCLNAMPLFHIHGLVGAVFSSLMAGSSVVCAPGSDPEKFFAWLEESQPTWYTAVPAIHQAILSRAEDHLETVRRSNLRFIRSSSAALPVKLMKELEARFGVPVIEAYGMTEAAHQIASNPLPPGKRKPGSVGVAAGPEIAVMDEAGGLLARGERGEIVLRGPNVAHGYDDSGGATAEAFTNGWFRTGDQGHMDEEGYLFITGRLKEMVNKGGEKISPKEVAEVLLTHPGIVQAAVFAVPHPTLGEDVAAAVVVRDKTQTTEAAIREYLAGRLAEFKIPSRVLIVDEIPESATGKIRRIGLAEALMPLIDGPFVAPKDDLESAVAKIYAAVLSAEAVGASDNFFELGGDSLKATQVLSRIRATFGVNLSIATIFRKATVVDLAHEIRRAIDATEKIIGASDPGEDKTKH
jgi:acyl-CoA synthetase (AMP-forming)/AMP-acid ligase II/acyl carrier protein